jgi:glycosyltransferase involved in cell wall biosynthesis
MAHIGICGLFIVPGRVGGAEYMLYNLIDGLSQLVAHDDDITVSLRAGHRIPMRPTIHYDLVSERITRNRFLMETFFSGRSARHFDALLFPNYFTPPVTRATRICTVIHDLQYLHYPKNFTLQKNAWLRICHEWTLRKADHVIAISHHVRQDLLSRYGHRFADNISVVPNPISWVRFEGFDVDDHRMNSMFRSPYILSVAAQYPHKNLETLIKGFSLIRSRHSGLRLVLVGQVPSRLVGTSRTAHIQDLIRDLGLSKDVVVTGHITDQTLGAFYRGASLFVFPSLFEGFGMPPIEALGLGLPVLTTKCTALPETTMGLAKYLDNPIDAEEMASSMLDMLSSPLSYAPSEEQVRMIRTRYSPLTVAQTYREILLGPGGIR